MKKKKKMVFSGSSIYPSALYPTGKKGKYKMPVVPWKFLLIGVGILFFLKPLMKLFKSLGGIVSGLFSGITSVTDGARAVVSWTAALPSAVGAVLSGGSEDDKTVKAAEDVVKTSPELSEWSPRYWQVNYPQLPGAKRTDLQSVFNSIDTLFRQRDIKAAARKLSLLKSKSEVSYMAYLIENKYRVSAFSLLRSLSNIADGFTSNYMAAMIRDFAKLPIK